MSDKNTDTNWKPWVPKELIDWELKVKGRHGVRREGRRKSRKRSRSATESPRAN